MASKSTDTKATLRQMMKQEKQKRIDSPLAKYTNTGQLCCALCNQQLTSETFWKAHVNGRDHKQKLLELKSNIKQTNADHVFAKPLPPSPLTGQQRGIKRSHDVASEKETKSLAPSGLPADFFDNTSSKANSQISSPVISSSAEKTVVEEKPSSLPEGFFDDPERDARVRKVEYVDRMEIEWDAFTREMKEETKVSSKLEATDDLEREVERDITEATELINRWQKIEQLHDIKDQRFKVKKEGKKRSTIAAQNTGDDDDEESLEKELESMYNWRQKRS